MSHYRTTALVMVSWAMWTNPGVRITKKAGGNSFLKNIKELMRNEKCVIKMFDLVIFLGT